MLTLVLASLRARKAAFAGAFLALFCAAALVTACGTLLDTGLRGRIAPERYAGAPLIVSGDQYVRETEVKKGKAKEKAKPIAERAWIPAELADRIGSVPGVERVVTEVTFPVRLPGVAQAWGHGWESAGLTPFTLRQGVAPRDARDLVVDARTAGLKGLSPGDEVDLGTGVYRVSGITAQEPEYQAALFFTTEEAGRLAGRPGMLTAIGVFPAVDVSRALEGTTATAHTGDARGRVEFLGAENARVRLISLGGALGGTSLLVAVLVVVGTLALTIQQRQREIAVLRAVAATPRQLREMIGRETLLVGLAAALPGSAAGLLLAGWLRTRFVELGAMPENLALVRSPFPVFAALVATAVTAWAAARLSARRVIRIRPVEALGAAALEPARPGLPRLVAGAVLLAGSIALTLVLSGLDTEAASSPVVVLAALLWTMAVAVLGPVIVRIAAAVLGPLLRLDGAVGHLAAANLRTRASRFASVLTPLTLMIALSATILFTRTTMEKAAEDEHRAGTRTSAPAVHTSVRVGLGRYTAQGVDPRAVDPGVRSGDLADLDEHTVAVGERMDREVGDTVRLTLGDGTPGEFEVIAVYTRDLAFGDLLFDRGLLARHVDDPYGAAAPAQNNAEVNYVAMGLIIAFAAIAVVNTLAMSTAERGREFALLRLSGATRRQVLRMSRWEALAATAVAAVLGSAIALVVLTAFSRGMTGLARPHVPPSALLAIVLAAGVLALVATALPARAALRTALTS